MVFAMMVAMVLKTMVAIVVAMVLGDGYIGSCGMAIMLA